MPDRDNEKHHERLIAELECRTRTSLSRAQRWQLSATANSHAVCGLARAPSAGG